MGIGLVFDVHSIRAGGQGVRSHATGIRHGFACSRCASAVFVTFHGAVVCGALYQSLESRDCIW